VIVDLPDTTVSAVSKALVKVREEGGVVALGRVLTLVISSAGRTDEAAIEAATDASREHPMRVIVLSTTRDADTRLDAEIRVGGDAGASEVVVLHASGETSSDPESLVTGLLLPDAPVVVCGPVRLRRTRASRRSDASEPDASPMPPPQPIRSQPSSVSAPTTRRATPTSRGPA
jgi:hypothetical protein